MNGQELHDGSQNEAMDFDLADADGTFLVTDRDGKTHRLPGIEGYRLMEIIRDSGLPIAALCGGACACGTCHIFVAPEWLERLPPLQDEEDGQLDKLASICPNSRLSCQIIWERAALDGLAVTLAPLEE